jgi:hypothetical protein
MKWFQKGKKSVNFSRTLSDSNSLATGDLSIDHELVTSLGRAVEARKKAAIYETWRIDNA